MSRLPPSSTLLTSDFSPQRFTTRAEEVARRAEMQAERPGLLEAIPDAIDVGWSGSWASRFIARQGYASDPTWAPSREEFGELVKDLPEHYWGEFEGSVSRAHAQKIRQQLLGTLKSEQRLASMGWQGTALTIGASILDPVALGASVLTAGAAAPWVFGAKVGRVGHFIRGGLVAGATDASIELALTGIDPDRGFKDILYSGLGSFALGGAADAFVGGRLRKAAQKLEKELAASDIIDSGLAISDKGNVIFREATSPEERRRIADSMIEAADLDEAERAAMRALPPEQIVQSAADRGPLNPAFDLQDGVPFEQQIDEAIDAGEDATIRAQAEAIKRGDSNALSAFDSLKAAAARNPNGWQADEVASIERVLAGSATPNVAGSIEPPRVPDVTYNGVDLHFHGITDSPAAWARGRWSLAGRLGRQAVPTDTRKVALALGGDNLSRARGGTLGERVRTSAQEWVNLEVAARGARFESQAAPIFKSWADRNNVPLMGRLSMSKQRRQFFEEVGDAVRAGGHADPDVSRAADILRAEHAELLNLAKRYNVRGFSDVPENPNYLMRMHDRAAIDRLIEEFDFDTVAGVIARSMMRASDTLSEDIATQVSRGYLRTVQRLGGDDDLTVGRLFSSDQTDTLEKILRAETKLTDDEIDQVLYRAAPPDPTRGVPARARRRLDLDETYVDPDLGFGIKDMLERNAETLFSAYLRQITGHAALAEVHRMSAGYSLKARPRFDGEAIDEGSYVFVADRPDMEPNLGLVQSLDTDANLAIVRFVNKETGAAATRAVPLETLTAAPRSVEWDNIPRDFPELLKRLQRQAKEEGREIRPRDAKRLEVLYRGVQGRRLHEGDPEIAEALRLTRNLQFMRVMNQSGFAQIADTANVIAEAGWRATVQQMPVLPQIFRRAKDGKLSNEFLQEIEAHFGAGTDLLRQQVFTRLDYGEGLTRTTTGRRLTRANEIAQQGTRITSRLGMIAPMNTINQKMAIAALTQRWANLASARKLPSKAMLDQLGLTEDMAKRIGDALQQHGDFVPGVLGRRVRRMNLDSWSDADAASHFMGAIDRWSRKAVQQSDVSSMALWMTKDWARVIVQFRTFGLQSWEKQFLARAQRIKQGDITVFANLAYGLLGGGLAYMAKEYVGSLGKADRAEILEKRLSPERIAAGAFSRSGWSSIFPPTIDSAAEVLGLEQPFAMGRTTGLQGDFAQGIPAVDHFRSILRAAKSVAGVPTEGFSRKDMENTLRALPFQNMVGIRNVIDAFGQSLPEEVPENRE